VLVVAVGVALASGWPYAVALLTGTEDAMGSINVSLAVPRLLRPGDSCWR